MSDDRSDEEVDFKVQKIGASDGAEKPADDAKETGASSSNPEDPDWLRDEAPEDELPADEDISRLLDDIPDDERLLMDEFDEDKVVVSDKNTLRPQARTKENIFTRKPWVVLGVAAIVVVVGIIVAIVGSYSSRVSKEVRQYQDAVSEVWDDRVDGSKEIKSAFDKVQGSADFREFRTVLLNERDIISSDIPSLSALAIPEDYRDSHAKLVEFLVGYKDYIDSVANFINQKSFLEVSGEQLDGLVEAGDDMSALASAYREQTDFIKSDLHSAVFEVVPENIKRIVQTEQGKEEDAKQQEEDEEQKQEEEAKQKEQEKQEAQDQVEAFLQAYIDGDVTAASSLLAEDKDYELIQGENNIVVDFTILSTTEKDQYYSVIVRLVREVVQEPVSTAPIVEPEISRQTSVNEIRIVKQDDAWEITFVEFLD